MPEPRYFGPVCGNCGARGHWADHCKSAGATPLFSREEVASAWANELASIRRNLNELSQPTDTEIREHWTELWRRRND